MSETLTQALGAFAYRLRYQDLPSEVVEKCKTFIMHGIGVGLCGFNTEIGQMGIEVAKKMGQGYKDGSTILVDGSNVPPTAAAFANVTMFHSLAEEDSYMRGSLHTGVCAIPPALAVGEVKRSTGKEVITAVAAGYEIGCRTSDTFAKLGVARGFRSTTVYGPMTAGITAAKLMGLKESQLIISLGWGANIAFGLIEWGLAKTNEMPLQNGFVASNGIIAAYLGQSDATVAPSVLEGDKGLYKSFAGTQENLNQITEGLGKTYRMVATELKRNPAGAHAQTPVLAMLQLLADHPFSAGQIERIKVRLNPGDTTYPGYKSLKPGIINVRYLLAIACLKKKLSAATVSLNDSQEVLDLMSRVEVIDDEEIPSETCNLSVVLKNGNILSKDLNMSEGKWCFSLAEEIAWQRKELVPEMAIEADKANKMIDIVMDFENCNDIGQLMGILVSLGRKSPRYRVVF